MADNQPVNPPVWRQSLAALLVAAGLAIIAVSFIWPGNAASRASWSNEQAQAYSAASAKLHGLSFETVGAAGSNKEKETREKLDKAKAEFDVLHNQLESAINRPRHISTAMRIVGGLIAASGAIILYYSANNSQT
jgi:hypothetical protein